MRSDCVGEPRPCPWLGCKYNVLLDVTDSGGIIFNHGRKVVPGSRGRSRNVERRLPIIGARTSSRYEELFESNLKLLIKDIANIGGSNCLLDLVENGKTHTLEETGDLLNITRERVRQIEAKALKRIRTRSTDDMEEWEEHERNT